ncbi:MAG TPA: RNA pseudouridine synthase [Pseudomonadales bacterium]
MSDFKHWRVQPAAPVKALDALIAETGLSKGRVRHAMNCGAVWLSRPGKSQKRLRRATAELLAGDVVDLYYDVTVLERKPIPAIRVADERRYSVWFKPPGLLTQGSRYGDHCSLSRQVEQHDPSRSVFMVHRLDREAQGLVLLAHDREAAARLSALFSEHRITKTYRVSVSGKAMERGELTEPIDGKEACTRFVRESYNAENDTSVLLVTLVTGRKHQIRRHLAGIGHPVLGDPRYGGRLCEQGLQLAAVSLVFDDPFERGRREYRI